MTDEAQRDEHDLVQHGEGGKLWSVCQRCGAVGPPHTLMPEDWPNDCAEREKETFKVRIEELSGKIEAAQRDELEGGKMKTTEKWIADELHLTDHEKTILQSKLDGLWEAVELAWGLIANAGGGNWSKETPDWQEAAARWRDEHWHLLLEDEAPDPAQLIVAIAY